MYVVLCKSFDKFLSEFPPGFKGGRFGMVRFPHGIFVGPNMGGMLCFCSARSGGGGEEDLVPVLDLLLDVSVCRVSWPVPLSSYAGVVPGAGPQAHVEQPYALGHSAVGGGLVRGAWLGRGVDLAWPVRARWLFVCLT